MPHQEEVNAWASYEQTARTPRRLSGLTSSLKQSRNSGVAYLSRLSSSCHPAIELSHLSGEVAFPTSSPPPPPQAAAAASNRPFFQQALSQRQQQGKSTARLATGQVASKRATLNTEILEKIQTTFAVFFEGALVSRDVDNKRSTKSGLPVWLASLNATMPWIQTSTKSPVLLFLDLCLRGIGQVVFQNSPLTGLLILIGLLIQSPRVALHGVLGLVVTNGVALLLGFDKGLAASGLFGYNAILVGLALATFDSQEARWATTLIASIGIATFSVILLS